MIYNQHLDKDIEYPCSNSSNDVDEDWVDVSLIPIISD